ncbi:DUF4907 domain-containing protein [Spirosoma sp. KCTC 42546]|uniref:DUF4907 domain-containing protein n=1 Tax=Spirosoma sp. KCTC 42546 TaxID=2520506 RepID=UPI00115A9B15|nr:DUF4907 domain-containing protein [Spirosoma sp. KCTC 42546]QDK79819.1 DUF4907 domain-containing protein [Spirosoma sp. KCTC 42546]
MTNNSQLQSRPSLVRLGLILFLISLAVMTTYLVYKRQPHYQVQVIKTAGGWGYDILNNNKLVIHQPTIPGQPGLVGFPSQEQAHRVGDWVVQKIQQTEAMPTLTNEDLRQLGVTIP